MSYEIMSEIKKLRHLAKLSEYCTESVWDGLSRDELLRVLDAWMACGWDICPDQWTRTQWHDVLRYGIVPAWYDDETPITYEARND